jgi:uncharacterized protein (TIGR00251 family)
VGHWYTWRHEALYLEVQVQPRASKDEIVGPLGERLKIHLTAAPVGGQANTRLISFLAKIFKVPKKHVKLVSGASSRKKCICIEHPTRLPDLIPPP